MLKMQRKSLDRILRIRIQKKKKTVSIQYFDPKQSSECQKMPTKVFGDLIEIGNQRAHFIHNDNAAIFANLGPDDLPFNDPAIKASVREPPILP